MTDRVPLHSDEIVLGQPVPWTVYDRNGKVLLRPGSVVQDPAMLERLLERAPLRERLASDKPRRFPSGHAQQSEAPELNPFEEFPNLELRAGQALDSLANAKSEGIAKLMTLVKRCVRHFEHAPDACIGLVHLHSGELSQEAHAIASAWLVYLLAQRVDKTVAPELLAAALTANLGMRSFQQELNEQTGGLTDEQRRMVQDHPSDSVWQLRKAGVEHGDWLLAVYQHHERSDGAGYPQGLKGDAINRWARMLAMVDCYLAMVGKRSYKEAKTPQQALRYFLECGHEHDQALSASLIRALGVYPPGSTVKLASGELAVVVQRNAAKPVAPKVRAVAAADGAPYSVVNERDTRDPAFKIKALLGDAPRLAVQPGSLWQF